MDDVFVINEGRLISYNGTMNTVEIPSHVSVIGENSFSNSNVHRIIIGKNVKQIESNAFHCCGSLKEIVLPDEIEFIGEMTNKCNQLKWIFSNPGTVGEEYAINHNMSVVPCSCLDQVWYISRGKVIKCFLKNERVITLPSGVISIEPLVFAGFCKLVSFIFSESVSNIGNKAFKRCTSLESIIIPDNVSSIGACTFESCIKLKNVTLPSSLEVLWGNCFNGCTSLREIVIPEGCKEINGLVFANCTDLRTVKIPMSVAFIQDNAFLGCSSKLELQVQEGSFALEYAKENNLNYIVYED